MSPDGLWAVLWGEPGELHKLHVGTAEVWIPCPNRRAFTRLLRSDDCFVSLVPRTARDDYALGHAHVLWCRVETPDSCQRLQRFRAGPTLVVREGASSRRTALWWLSEPLYGDWITRATERLTYALKGRRRAADISALMPSPWTRLTYGRKRPSPTFIEYESDARMSARQIVGGLPDAPSPDAWRERAA